MAAGGITVPAYTTNTEGDHRHILVDSGAVAPIVSSPALARAPAAGGHGGPDLPPGGRHGPARGGAGVPPSIWSPGTTCWPRARRRRTRWRRSWPVPSATTSSCFIYTSGTGGAPKGVMLTHRNMLANCMRRLRPAAALGAGPGGLPVLPAAVSHAYEHTVPASSFRFPSAPRSTTPRAPSKLLGNLAEARPTIMTAVPRLYESMHQRINRAVAKEKPLRQRLFRMTLRSSARSAHARLDSLSPLEWLLDRLARAPGARQDAPPLRRPPQGHGLRRRRPQPRHRLLLHRPRAAGLAGLRPDRGGAGRLRQPAGPGEDGHRRPAAGRRRGEASPETARSWCAASWS